MSSTCESKPAAAGGCCGAGVPFDGASPTYRRILLARYRGGYAIVRSVWLRRCNDLIERLAVAGAGGVVILTSQHWPDLVPGLILAAILLQSTRSIVPQSRRELLPVAA